MTITPRGCAGCAGRQDRVKIVSPRGPSNRSSFASIMPHHRSPPAGGQRRGGQSDSPGADRSGAGPGSGGGLVVARGRVATRDTVTYGFTRVTIRFQSWSLVIVRVIAPTAHHKV